MNIQCMKIIYWMYLNQLHKFLDLFSYWKKMDKSKLIFYALLLRILVSLHPWSGMNVSPRFGDFEAQRHWMEITVSLPMKDWYFYDLQYWGIDYPPLTCYHSWLVGKASQWVVPEMTEFEKSRGIETDNVILFMRYSVIVFDIIFIYACLMLFPKEEMLLFSPCILLIDHGHFQYNSIGLGLFLLSFYYLKDNQYVISAILFVLSLNFKQMALYYSLPLFVYFLRKSNLPVSVPAVLFTFVILWYPLPVAQVLKRIFPFERGIIQDKVSNLWTFTNLIYKLHKIPKIGLISLITTFTSVLPSVIMVIRNPNIRQLALSLNVVSLCFYLFSFHVHEKTILYPWITFFLRNNENRYWMTFISTFSMYPLFIQDKLQIAYFALMILFLMFHSMPLISLFGAILIHILCLFSPPSRLPDLWTVLICTYSFFHFIYFLILAYKQQYLERNDVKNDE